MVLTQAELQRLLGSRYSLQRELGGGSMAAVYLAEDARHGRQVAIKVLRPEYASTIAAERFLREIEIAALLQHPHIVPLLDSGEVGGNLFLIMPFIEGESLRVRLVREGRLAAGEVIRIICDVADALAYAHQKGIVHRDIKPDNILLAGRHALVADFGVAKAVSAATVAPRELTIGVALGTPAYMAPEQATAAPDLDHRVDLYALGVVAYELLSGHPPFEGPTAQAILTAHVLEAPVPLLQRRPDSPPAFAAIIDRCLAKRPDDRCQSAEDLLRQLEPLATPSGGSTPASVAPLAQPRSVRRMTLAAAAIVFVAAVVLALVTRRVPALGMSGVQRQITFMGQVTAAAISPDGQLLAFVSDSGGRNHLMLQDLRGGQAIQLSVSPRFDYPTWSADGSEIRCFVFDSAVGVLRRIPRLGGPARDLPATLWAALSPNGDRLAELRQGGGDLTIRDLVRNDSVTARLVTGWWYSVPAWSPDGERLAWAAVSQSGSGLNRLWVMSARTLEPKVVQEDSLTLGAPTWDGDGKAVYYLRGRNQVVDLMRLPMGRSGPAGSPEVIRGGLTSGVPPAYVAFQPPPSVSADGRKLIYTQRQEWSNLGLASFEEWRKDRSFRTLTTGSASYDFARLSPDQRQLAVERTESDGLSLQILSLDGGAPRELGRLSSTGGLAWSPKGDQIVVASIDPESGRGLKLFPLDGNPPHTVAQGEVGDTPEWLNDSAIVVPRVGNRSLQMVELPSGRRALLPGLDTTGWMFWPRMVPGGGLLAFAWNRGQGNQGIFAIRPPNPEMVTLWSGLMNPARWSADGRRLFLVGAGFLADSSQVISVGGDGRDPRVLGVFPSNLEVADVTSDGRRAVLILHEHRADAWVIQFPAAGQ